MKPTLIHLPQELIEQLDARAEREGVSRSQLVRDAIGALFESEPDAELAAQIHSAYTEHPLSEPDAWGDMASFLEAVRSARTDGS